MSRHNPYRGLHRSPKKLADGTREIYYYAWKGGPGLYEKFGSREFDLEFFKHQAARSERTRPRGRTIHDVVQEYLTSRASRKSSFTGFLDLRDRTQTEYRRIITRLILPQFGSMPIDAVQDVRARGQFLAYRDEVAEKTERQADHMIQVLSIIFSFACDRGIIKAHPLRNVGRVHKGSRKDRIWTEDLEARFVSDGRADLALALEFGMSIGQRPGDLFNALWVEYDGSQIRVWQSKTQKWVVVPLLAETSALLNAVDRRGPTILTNLAGSQWTYGGFSKVFRKEMAQLDIRGVSIGDVRGTAVTRLRRAGCSNAEIGAITGHSDAVVSRILEKHYAAEDPALAIQAMKKLELHYRSAAKPTCSPSPRNY